MNDAAVPARTASRPVNGLSDQERPHRTRRTACHRRTASSTNDGLSDHQRPDDDRPTGRDQVAYIVRCALPANTSITRRAATRSRACWAWRPQWQNGACDTNCQEDVSACLLAHVNTAGIHVPLWMVAQNAAVGWGQDPGVPEPGGRVLRQRVHAGAHGTDPTKVPTYYCTGAKYNVNPPQGALGSTQTSPPYVNPFGTPTPRASANYRCAAADYSEPDRRLQGLQRLEQRRHGLAAEHDDDDHGQRRRGPRLPLAVTAAARARRAC